MKTKSVGLYIMVGIMIFVVFQVAFIGTWEWKVQPFGSDVSKATSGALEDSR